MAARPRPLPDPQQHGQPGRGPIKTRAAGPSPRPCSASLPLVVALRDRQPEIGEETVRTVVEVRDSGGKVRVSKSRHPVVIPMAPDGSALDESGRPVMVTITEWRVDSPVAIMPAVAAAVAAVAAVASMTSSAAGLAWPGDTRKAETTTRVPNNPARLDFRMTFIIVFLSLVKMGTGRNLRRNKHARCRHVDLAVICSGSVDRNRIHRRAPVENRTLDWHECSNIDRRRGQCPGSGDRGQRFRASRD